MDILGHLFISFSYHDHWTSAKKWSTRGDHTLMWKISSSLTVKRLAIDRAPVRFEKLGAAFGVEAWLAWVWAWVGGFEPRGRLADLANAWLSDGLLNGGIPPAALKLFGGCCCCWLLLMLLLLSKDLCAIARSRSLLHSQITSLADDRDHDRRSLVTMWTNSPLASDDLLIISFIRWALRKLAMLFTLTGKSKLGFSYVNNNHSQISGTATADNFHASVLFWPKAKLCQWRAKSGHPSCEAMAISGSVCWKL